jgi:hypothetical protein
MRQTKADILFISAKVPAVLNLGYAYPKGYVKRSQGVREEPTGVRKIKKPY